MGQAISLLGTWVQHVAMAWLVYRMTGSAFWLGVVGFAGHIPHMFFSPVAGVLADKWDKKKILYLTQALSLWQAVMLTVLTLGQVIELWHVIGLAAFLGLVNAVDVPTRQSFFVELIEQKKDIGNAIALNSSTFNIARLLGPALAGLLIAMKGEGICFLINAVSFVPILVSLYFVRSPKRKKGESTIPVWRGFKEGARYLFQFSPIRDILFLMAFLGLFGMPFHILFPVFASEILHAGSKVYGALAAAVGLGALAGALVVASKKNVLGFEKIILFSSILFSVGMIAFSQSRSFFVALVVLFWAGLALMVQMACANTVIQMVVDDDKRGRVMSFYSMAIVGTAPFGSLLMGSLASHFGVSFALLLCGLICLAGALIFTRRLASIRKKIHPHYVKMGIVPEVASGLAQATTLQSTEE